MMYSKKLILTLLSTSCIFILGLLGQTSEEHNAYTRLTAQKKQFNATALGGIYQTAQVKKRIKEINRLTSQLQVSKTNLQRIDIGNKAYKIFFDLKTKYFYRDVAKIMELFAISLQKSLTSFFDDIEKKEKLSEEFEFFEKFENF
ncbi:hypothetical protein KAH94_06275 [bacterium]|nr:hypothetical protein [bacterium]